MPFRIGRACGRLPAEADEHHTNGFRFAVVGVSAVKRKHTVRNSSLRGLRLRSLPGQSGRTTPEV